MAIPDRYLNALVEISQEINSIQDLETLLNRILDVALQRLSAERGFILLRDGEAGELMPAAVRNIDPEAVSDAAEISSTAVDKVIASGTSILTFDTDADAQFDEAHSVVLQKIRSIACVPLSQKGTVIGVIYMDSRGRKADFTRQSLDFLDAFANQAAIAIENAQLLRRLRRENDSLRAEFQRVFSFREILGESSAMKAVFDMMNKVLTNHTTVLLVGETGTGKELIARAIHYNGLRQDKPFIPVNCAAIPENLIESELFGYRKGAFTGATADKKGLFEAAHQGTLFLDEVGEFPLSLQAKLLRVLQEKEVMPVGSVQSVKVDVRIVAATNRELSREVAEGRFREDLYYRLNIVPITVPPLRDRRKDIPLLAHHFLKKYAAEIGKPLTGFERDVVTALEEYGWPGNVRQLENAIERAVVFADGPTVARSDLLLTEATARGGIEAGMTLDEVSRALLEKTLRACDGNKTRAAEQMGVSLRWIHYKIKEWDIGVG